MVVAGSASVTGGAPTLVHPSHITGVTSLGTGKYKVILENSPSFGSTTSDEGVFALDSATHAAVDTDFDIIALCPGT